MELRQQIIKEMVRLGISLLPMNHCPDGEYEDFDEWDTVYLDNVPYDINFWSDGDTFYITAYHVSYDGQTLTRENDNFFRILEIPLKETA